MSEKLRRTAGLFLGARGVAGMAVAVDNDIVWVVGLVLAGSRCAILPRI